MGVGARGADHAQAIAQEFRSIREMDLRKALEKWREAIAAWGRPNVAATVHAYFDMQEERCVLDELACELTAADFEPMGFEGD